MATWTTLQLPMPPNSPKLAANAFNFGPLVAANPREIWIWTIMVTSKSPIENQWPTFKSNPTLSPDRPMWLNRTKEGNQWLVAWLHGWKDSKWSCDHHRIKNLSTPLEPGPTLELATSNHANKSKHNTSSISLTTRPLAGHISAKWNLQLSLIHKHK